MKLEFLSEPRLIFANGEHICPRRGISAYGVFDQTQETRRGEIYVGGVGSSECMEMLGNWLDRCRAGIDSPKDAKQENLKLPFCGFSQEGGYGADIRFSSELARPLKNSDIAEVIAIKSGVERIQAAIDLYYENIKFLAQNRHVDVIVCVMPEKLYKAISTDEASGEETLEESKAREELNFRRALKARSMSLGKPLQLIRQVNLDSTKFAGQQDDATKAWNFCTALYYKSGPTIPWKLKQESSRVTSCAVGIAFYRSRDRQTLCTSLAQIFDELGNGLILRGTPVQIDKDDRVPRLTAQQSHDLITAALHEYRIALRNFPARVVVHKSSNFTAEEIDGIENAARELRVDAVDFVTILDSRFRLFRDGNYPPFRGTLARIDDSRMLLYSRGSVWYYQTYPGMYVPQPIELRVVKSEVSPMHIAREILGLTKMNWNNTQFDGKYPVTLGCARKVGEIMKYLNESDTPQVRYGYYM
jgi:hypothetical protein